LTEIQKLYDMNVIEAVQIDDKDEQLQNVVDTTLVYDWRFRCDQWIRRCRIVAREYKDSATTEQNFAPTSSFASVRMLLIFALIHKLCITVLDVSDAFLMVPQVELMHVVIPAWVRELTPEKPFTHWVLHRCLPGQRNAALRWHEFFNGLCSAAGLVAFPGAPTVLRHLDLDRSIFVNVHMDDILLISRPQDGSR